MRNILNSLLNRIETKLKEVEALADHYAEEWDYPEQVSVCISDGRRVMKFLVSLREGHYKAVTYKDYNSRGTLEVPIRSMELKAWQLSILLSEEFTVTFDADELTAHTKLKRKV